jgi:hypothetical protein
MAHKPSALLDTRAIYRGDNLDQLRKLPPVFRNGVLEIVDTFCLGANGNKDLQRPKTACVFQASFLSRSYYEPCRTG